MLCGMSAVRFDLSALAQREYVSRPGISHFRGNAGREGYYHEAQLTADGRFESCGNLRPDRFFALRSVDQKQNTTFETKSSIRARGGELRRIPISAKDVRPYNVKPVPGGQYLISVPHILAFLLSPDGQVSPANDFSRLGYDGRLHNGNFLSDYGDVLLYRSRLVWARETDPTGKVLWESIVAPQVGKVHVQICYGLIRLGFDEPRLPALIWPLRFPTESNSYRTKTNGCGRGRPGCSRSYQSDARTAGFDRRSQR